MSLTTSWSMNLRLLASASQAKSLPFVGNLNQMNKTSRKASSAIANCARLTFFGDIKLAGRIRESKNNRNSISKLKNDIQFRRQSGIFGVHCPIFGIEGTDPSPMMPSVTDSAGRAPRLAKKVTDETPERARRRVSPQQSKPAELESPAPAPSCIARLLVLLARPVRRSPAEETDPAAPVAAKTPAPMERHASSPCLLPAQAYPFQLAPALIVAAGTSEARPKGDPASKR